MKRYGQIIKVKPDMLERYSELHRNPWPEVNQMILECNMRNYSIYHAQGYLFAYFEYVGTDFEADMEKMAADPFTQKWWKECEPCQEPIDGAGPGVWWSNMEELYHLDES